MPIANPLEGITVLDLGQMYNGPYCGFLLANAGARVIKVESPEGETLRKRASTTSQCYPFAMLNGGKECITIDLKLEQGQVLLKDLAKKVDILIENFAPGTLEKYNLSSDHLCAVNPRLIYASSTGFGNSGPYKQYRGMDITLQAMSGLMSVTGYNDTEPLKAGAAICDFMGGIHLYGGVVSALYQRERTGKGAVLDISMQDCMFPPLTTAVGAFFETGNQRPRTGNRHPALSVAPYNVYRAADGHIAIICIRDFHWRRLCEAMNRPDLLEDSQFSTMQLRADNMEALDKEVEKWTMQYSKQELFEITQNFDLITAPVQELSDVVSDPHLHARGTLEWTEHSTLGEIALNKTPLRYEGYDAPPLRPVADLGAHTDAVLSELLDLDATTLGQLKAQRVI